MFLSRKKLYRGIINRAFIEFENPANGDLVLVIKIPDKED